MATPMDAEYMYHINSTRTENIRICEISVTTHPYRLLINNYGTCKTLPRVRLMQATHIYIMLVLLLVSGNISQLEESKCIDQKDAGSIPLRANYFSSNSVRLLAYVFIVGDLPSESLKRGESNGVYWFETRF